jgi:hypothetical protein
MEALCPGVVLPKDQWFCGATNLKTICDWFPWSLISVACTHPGITDKLSLVQWMKNSCC